MARLRTTQPLKADRTIGRSFQQTNTKSREGRRRNDPLPNDDINPLERELIGIRDDIVSGVQSFF